MCLSSLDFFVSIFLLIFGTYLSFRLLWVLVFPVIGRIEVSDILINRTIRSAERRLENLKLVSSSAVVWSDIFVFQPSSIRGVSRIGLSVIDKVYRTNLKIVEKMIEMHSAQSFHLQQISKLPDLVEERRSVMLGVLEVHRARKNIQERRENKGKETPQWAFTEFEKKLRDLGRALRDNEAEIKSVLSQLAAPASRAESNPDSVIH